jgi:hypothetical protein
MKLTVNIKHYNFKIFNFVLILNILMTK